LTDYLVGTGGWAYFNVPGKPALKTYSEIFRFVEVNYTFYEYPPVEVVERWRRTVPPDFTFSVRCHQDLTHRIGLKPVDEAYEVFYKMKTYADILRTPYLVLETPASYSVSHETRDFFLSLNMKGIRLVWEYRAPMSVDVVDVMRDYGVIQSVDLSREKPVYETDVAYSRLFGKGQQNIWQFTNSELAEIQRQAEETGSNKVFMSFHGLRMNTDAIRFQQHLQTGTYPPATSETGADSAKAVLAEDAQFPSSRSQLIEKEGWKVIDVAPNATAHLSDFLSSIPNKNYGSLNEVVKELKAVL
jgi:uncharacterized protein YecE (DUF72 family)